MKMKRHLCARSAPRHARRFGWRITGGTSREISTPPRLPSPFLALPIPETDAQENLARLALQCARRRAATAMDVGGPSTGTSKKPRRPSDRLLREPAVEVTPTQKEIFAPRERVSTAEDLTVAGTRRPSSGNALVVIPSPRRA